MKDLIWGAVGVVIALAAAVYLIKLLRLKKRGITVLAEVIAVAEKKKRRVIGLGFFVLKTSKVTASFVHTLRYMVGEKPHEAEDAAEYIQPFKVGEKHLIVYSPDDPDKFEYEEDLKKNINITAALLVMSVIFSARWLFTGLKSVL